MTPSMFVFFLYSITGAIGLCIVLPRPGVIPPSTRNIDHPCRPWRIFYRAMTICMCNLYAHLITLILLVVYFDTSDLSNLTHAWLLATLPIPLVIVFYWLFAKVARKMARKQQ